MEKARRGSIVLIERTGKGGTTSLGTAIRFEEQQLLPIVPFTGDDDLYKPAPMVDYAEVDGFPLWAGFQGIEFQDPHTVQRDNLRRGRLRLYLCPIQDRTRQFAERLGLSLHKDGLSGDGFISPEGLSYDETVTHFPNIFQNRH